MSFAKRLVPLAARLAPEEASAAGSRHSRRWYADHGEAKVNAWEAPTQIGKWKEEHVVFAVLGSWAIGIYGSMKVFGGKKPDASGKEATPAPAGPRQPAKH